ncbi:MAG: hypothetical protein ACXWZG_07950 [Microbacterium sp.]
MIGDRSGGASDREGVMIMAKKPDQTMVVEYDRNGEIDVLELRSRPLPGPALDEVTVEVICAGISHIDGFIRGGRRRSGPTSRGRATRGATSRASSSRATGGAGSRRAPR